MRGVKILMAMALAALVSPAAPDAAAQALVSEGQSFISGRLLPGTRAGDGTRLAGLRLTLTDGWKTYWRSPGEAGIPPSFDWSGSENVASVRVLWPRPEVFMSFGMQTIGYSGQVVLPMIVTPVDPNRPIRLDVAADMGVCKDVCVLERFTLSKVIEQDERPVGAGQIARARATVPPAGKDAGLARATCRITGAGRERRLELQLAFVNAVDDPVVVIEGNRNFWVSNVVSRQSGAGVIDVEARLSLESDSAWITRQDLRMTVLAGNMSADVHGCSAPAN